MNRHPKVIINALAAAAACFLALGLSSCTTEEMEASLSYSPTSVSVGSAGGSFELALSATVSYSVSVSGDWLWPSSGDLYWLNGYECFCRVPGSAVLEFTAEANTSTSARTATIKITAGDLSATVSVTQAGTDGSGDEDDTEDEDSGDSSDDSGNYSYDVSGTLNGYEYVDLGLSVMWATCNIGADSPEEYGDYYAWGETETKDTYTMSNSVTYGVSMSDIAGNAYYDAATANWGSTWRMPTDSELTELRTSCTLTWITQNSVKGYEVTGTNGNSIFLPAAGFCDGSILRNAGSQGYYWSSTPYTSYTDYAYDLEFGSSSFSRNRNLRYYGLCVRPVFGDSSEDSGSSSGDDSGDDSEGDNDASGTINGYEYVDLGLSVKWATCNIGADSPEDYGNYYAWGETVTKSTYTTSNSVTYGVSKSDISGDAEYDAATANWGSPWRMPTSSEIDELISDCTLTWTTLNSVNGYEVTGTNGNSIFLPAAAGGRSGGNEIFRKIIPRQDCLKRLNSRVPTLS